jgi:hypothetical protein
MNPLFVLYDLRVVFKHLQSEENRLSTLKSCRFRLGLGDNATCKEIYESLMGKLVTFYTDLRIC